MLQNIVLYLHLVSLAVAICGVLYADSVGFAWIRGKVPMLTPKTLDTLHDVISYALAALILTGLYMFWPLRAYLLHQPLFLLKLAFIAALVVNSIVIDKLMLVATKVPFASVSDKGRLALLASGGLSFVCWVGAIACAIILFGWPF